MLLKFGFLLLGFAVAANAQLGPFCSCKALKNCIEAKRSDLRRKNSDCVALCKSKFGDKADANAAAGCVNQQREDLDVVKKTELKCLLDPSGGACLADSATARHRAKRQAAAQTQTNTNAQAQGGGLQVQGSGLQVQGGGLQVQGSGLQTQGGGLQVQTQGSASANSGVDIDSLIKPFHDCVRNCTKDREPATVVAGAQTADEDVAKHLRGIEECSIKIGCAFNVASVNQAARSCRANNSTELESRTKGIKLRYCNCVRDALGKTTDEVPCLPSRG